MIWGNEKDFRANAVSITARCGRQLGVAISYKIYKVNIILVWKCYMKIY